MSEKKHPWLAPLGKFVGIALGAAVVSVISSMGVTNGVKAEAKASATVSAKTTAEEETRRAEKAKAIYLSGLNDALEGRFAVINDDLDAIDDDISGCLEIAREARTLADAALQLMSGRFSRAAIERTIVDVERADPAPAPRSDKPDRRQQKLPSYLIRED